MVKTWMDLDEKILGLVPARMLAKMEETARSEPVEYSTTVFKLVDYGVGLELIHYKDGRETWWLVRAGPRGEDWETEIGREEAEQVILKNMNDRLAQAWLTDEELD